MKKIYGVIILFAALCLGVTSAFAGEKNMVESYAHPTMFGSAEQVTVSADAAYVVGGKMYRSENQVGVKGKDNVMVDSWVKDILATIKDNTDQKVFNPKMPVLRSELAVILAEGLALKDAKSSNYTDICPKYWAKAWIDKATNAKVMIGYPDKSFRPDQPVTKAEVFATIATLIEVPTDRSLLVPDLKGHKMQYIPKWAIAPTKEVMAS